MVLLRLPDVELDSGSASVKALSHSAPIGCFQSAGAPLFHKDWKVKITEFLAGKKAVRDSVWAQTVRVSQPAFRCECGLRSMCDH